MRVLKMGLAVAFMAASMVTISGVSSFGGAEAKDQPGKCGTLKYFSKKTKKCVSAVR